ncbi:MAG: cellulase family glycosylhydrolase [Kiritimatiellae bacterium]|nr:cellulase family glycosylhydrolase [Kiritimatiellia bacterium]
MKRVLLIVLFLSAAASLANGQAFFSVQGRQIVDPAGNPFPVKGNALSGWQSPEAYMLRLNDVHDRHIGSYSSIRSRIREILGSDQDAQAFWNAYNANFLTEADLAEMATDGFNTIRVPINYRLLSPAGTPGVYDEAGFQKLDQIIQWCANQGLYVILDLHACPGGQSHDAPSDPEHTYWTWDDGRGDWVEAGVACLWEYNADYFAATGRTPEFNKQRTIDLWRTIADRYKNEAQVIGYELINEPFLPYGVHWPDLRDLLIRITAAIREVDTNHIIFAEGNFYAGTFEGMFPLWDNNMALMFHKYWRPTTYNEIAQYVEAGISNNVPVVMSESGENSNPWFYEFARLLETHGIGWVWWGSKKVDNISAAYSAVITPDYQYVIDNFRDLPIDPARAFDGLMDLAGNVASVNCDWDPGFVAALLDPLYNSVSQPYASHVIPGKINCVNYDIGHQGVAFSDTRYKNEEDWSGGPWNEGWLYRNDGVDIAATSEGCGLTVGWTADGEWLKYTIQSTEAANYDIVFRTATPYNGGALRLYVDGNPLTGNVSVPRSGSYTKWKSVTVSPVALTSGPHVLELRIVTGGFDIASVEFKKRRR